MIKRLSILLLIVLTGCHALRVAPALPGHPSGGDVSPAQMEAIKARIAENIKRIGPIVRTTAEVLYRFPIGTAPEFTDLNSIMVAEFVDHDARYPDFLLDYNNGARTYDLAGGYNHAGTDIMAWPFPWNLMDENKILAVAAADGVIVDKADGFYDRNCAIDMNAQANYVVLQHADGFFTWYFHMKTGTVTTKGVGESVAAGEVLGVVGSSGSSTGPHLHFEVHDTLGNVVDPFNGPANPVPSRWISQRPYFDPALIRITIGDGIPDFPACSAGTAHEVSRIRTDQQVYLSVYFRELSAGQSIQCDLLRPDGSVYSHFEQTLDRDYPAGYYYWYLAVGSAQPSGAWSFACAAGASNVSKSFSVCGSTPGKPVLLSPKASGRVSRKVSLTWSAVSCSDSYQVVVRSKSASGRVVKRVKGLTTPQLALTLPKKAAFVWQTLACSGTRCRASSWRRLQTK